MAGVRTTAGTPALRRHRFVGGGIGVVARDCGEVAEA
ncbi:hypothetical protein [Streptomyces californicus]